MAKKNAEIKPDIKPMPAQDRPISQVLETNFMPYAMSTIVSRAIPDIDGLKPVHRKILYMMYKMGLLNGSRAKSAKVVGQVMMLHPHGDLAIYETMVRLTTDKEALLHPFVDSKGSFGKQYSDMAFAASRYTEVKLEKFSEELFSGIEKDSVDFIDSFDGGMKEPSVLPTAFPNVLVMPNLGLAVGMTCNICSFNLAEICDATCEYLRDPSVSVDRIMEIMPAPDFSTGGLLLYDREKMREIYMTGRGSFTVRSKYNYDKKNNCVEVTQITYTTTLEKIIDACAKLIKDGKIRDISDIRDETDIDGLKIAFDFKRGADYEKTMLRLMKQTPLEDSFACNFNVLIGGTPRTLGVLGIIDEWCAFREECLRREFTFDLSKKTDKLHLLYGLKKILLDIDKAIRIVRNTPNDSEVVPNLMKGFDIDKEQAEFVADIKLRHLNREYILDRISEIEQLEKEIDELNSLLSSKTKIKKHIIKQLTDIKNKYGKKRKTELCDISKVTPAASFEEPVEDYPVIAVLSAEGYFKKCTAQSMKGADAQKLKDGDRLILSQETKNNAEMLFFTSKAQVYKAKLDSFDITKASALGDYIPVKLGFEADEKVIGGFPCADFTGQTVFFFENGKAVKIPTDSYLTKNNRKKLTAAFFGDSPCVYVGQCGLTSEYLLISDTKRALLVKESLISLKTTRTSSGSYVFTLKKGQRVDTCLPYGETSARLVKESKYRKSKLPSNGVVFEEYDIELAQQTFTGENQV